ncbi:MAG: HPr family phosphocarrier protein [Alphaproteobacteria bacterium]|nr:HPr family phosphocarrier protein [Alphaproteobacteria bacterium]
MPAGAPAPSEIHRTVTIRNQRGLHARAAARFVKLAFEYDADVTVTKAGSSVSGKSIMGLMMLAAGPGSTIDLSATGPDAASAVDALVALITGGFNED